MRPGVNRLPGGEAAWYAALEALIEDAAALDTPGRLVTGLGHLVSFELATMFVYRGRSRPLHIYDNFRSSEEKRGIANYIESTYVLNPLYLARQKGLPDGVYRIRDLAPDAFFQSEVYRSHRILPRRSEEIGYLTRDWPEGMEEADLVVTLEAGVAGELSIYRSSATGGLRDQELARLAAVVPVARALLRRFWACYSRSRTRVPPPDDRVDLAFAAFGREVLSEREREVVQLILRGHSSESIGANLGISLGTVKTHRKNAYAKLGVCSQSELLSRFLQSLQAQ